MIGMGVADALALARRHLREGRPAAAQTISRQVVEATNAEADAFHLLGLSLLTGGDPAAAETPLAQAAGLAPADVVIATNLGHARRLAGRLAEAAGAYQSAVAHDPSYAPARYGLGLTLAAAGDRAGGAAQRALALALIPAGEDALTGIDGPQCDARFRIYAYLSACEAAGAPARVVVGGHWTRHSGWLILDAEDQSAAAKLAFPDTSLDALFIGDGFAALTFPQAEGFFAEAARVLRPGGTLRVATVTMERLFAADGVVDPDATVGLIAERLSDVATVAWGGVDPRNHLAVLALNVAAFTEGRRFLWSAGLMGALLERVGFVNPAAYPPGQGARPELCIERGPHIASRLFNPTPEFLSRLRGEVGVQAVEAFKPGS